MSAAIGFITTWIGHYCSETDGTDYANDATDRLDDDNQPQPDVSLFIDEKCGGQMAISDDGYLTGGPELIVEVSGSSLAIDRGPKLRTYERHGVLEYIIWRVEDRMIEWYVRREGKFVPLPIPEDGIYRSETFSGLWLPIEAMLSRNGRATLAVLDQGLTTPEHAEFVRRLAEARS